MYCYIYINIKINNLIMINITDDIIESYNDYINSCKNANLDEIVDYIYIILTNIYEKKKIYKEYIEQVVSENNKLLNKNYNFEISDKKKRVEELLLKPQSIQRSEQWYKERENSIGASELASVFNKNPFCSFNNLILKKCNKLEKISGVNKYCQHGIKYEDIVQKIYSEKTKTKIIEFGSIQHEEYSFIRASPDGITENGIMLEIKVPLSRKINGIPQFIVVKFNN